MKLELNNDEINEAIVAYVSAMGINITGRTVSVDITAGRKNGNTAEVTIEETVPTQEAPQGDATAKEAKVTPVAEVAEKNEAAKEESVAEDDDDSLFSS